MTRLANDNYKLLNILNNYEFKVNKKLKSKFTAIKRKTMRRLP